MAMLALCFRFCCTGPNKLHVGRDKQLEMHALGLQTGLRNGHGGALMQMSEWVATRSHQGTCKCNGKTMAEQESARITNSCTDIGCRRQIQSWNIPVLFESSEMDGWMYVLVPVSAGFFPEALTGTYPDMLALQAASIQPCAKFFTRRERRCLAKQSTAARSPDCIDAEEPLADEEDSLSKTHAQC